MLQNGSCSPASVHTTFRKLNPSINTHSPLAAVGIGQDGDEHGVWRQVGLAAELQF